MGSTFVKYERLGTSAREVFEELKKELVSKYGGYNYGSLVMGANARSFSRMVTDDAITLTKNEVQKEKEREHIDKDVLSYVDMGIDHFEGLRIKKDTIKGEMPKYEMYYVVRNGKTINELLFKDKKKAIAEEKMLEFATRYPDCYVAKEYVLVQGNPIVSKPIISKEITKTRPTTKNEKVVEIHKFVFYGWVSE